MTTSWIMEVSKRASGFCRDESGAVPEWVVLTAQAAALALAVALTVKSGLARAAFDLEETIRGRAMESWSGPGGAQGGPGGGEI